MWCNWTAPNFWCITRISQHSLALDGSFVVSTVLISPFTSTSTSNVKSYHLHCLLNYQLCVGQLLDFNLQFSCIILICFHITIGVIKIPFESSHFPAKRWFINHPLHEQCYPNSSQGPQRSLLMSINFVFSPSILAMLSSFLWPDLRHFFLTGHPSLLFHDKILLILKSQVKLSPYQKGFLFLPCICFLTI